MPPPAITQLASREQASGGARLRASSCILDGEAVSCGDDGIASFERMRDWRRGDSDCCITIAPWRVAVAHCEKRAESASDQMVKATFREAGRGWRELARGWDSYKSRTVEKPTESGA
jgi:hypothetical protein